MDTKTNNELRRRRRAVDLTQQELAHNARCSVSLIGMIEHGYQAGTEVMDRIDAALREHEDVS